MKIGILIWLGFNVLVNFLPYLILVGRGILRSNIPSFRGFVTAGELLIISIAVAADTAGTLIEKLIKSQHDNKALLVLFMILLFVFVFFGITSLYDVKFNSDELELAAIFNYSIAIFFASFAISLIARSEMEKN